MKSAVAAAEPCAPWAYYFDASGTTVAQRDGVLQVTPRGTGAVVSTPGAYTSLNAGSDDSIQAANGELIYETGDAATQYAKISFELTTMRWWKLHEEQGMWAASYSADGLSDWVMFGQRPAPAARNVQVAVLAGLFVDMPEATGAARYGRLLL